MEDSARFLRIDEVAHRLGLSRTGVYELIRDGKFPRGCKVTPHRVCWPASDVDNFISRQVAARDAAAYA